MELQQINESLVRCMTDLGTKVRLFAQAEYVYERRFADLVTHSGMGTAILKEAEAKLTLEQEGLWEPLATLRGEVRALYHEKDMLIALSANVRSLNRNESDHAE